MTHDISVTTRRLVEYASQRAREGLVTEAVHDYLTYLTVPTESWGQLSFAKALGERWANAVTASGSELFNVRRDINGMAEGVLRAAADYEQADVSASIELIDSFDLDDEGLPSSLLHVYRQTYALSAEPGLVDIRTKSTGVGRHMALPAHLDPDNERNTPGHTAMAAFCTEHLSTLIKAEQLLRDAQKLDFKGPTAYLDELVGVDPGSVLNRADLFLTARDTVEPILVDVVASTKGLSEVWEGQASIELLTRSGLVAEAVTELVGHLSWLNRDGVSAGRVLDDLLQSIADDAQGIVESVNGSRISRIAEIVELVEEANGYRVGAPASSSLGLSASSTWAFLSDADVDSTIHVLYKRVWYLSRAFSKSIGNASKAAQTLFIPDETRSRPTDRLPNAPRPDTDVS